MTLVVGCLKKETDAGSKQRDGTEKDCGTWAMDTRRTTCWRWANTKEEAGEGSTESCEKTRRQEGLVISLAAKIA